MLLKTMLDKQAVLDKLICSNNGIEDCYSYEFYSKRKLALAVEIGEMANETNCFKYWKKHNEINRDKLIEELVDCIHFTLSLLNLDEVHDRSIYRIVTWDISIEDIYVKSELEDIEKQIWSLYTSLSQDRYIAILTKLISIAKYYGYTAEEMVQAYKEKYEKNIERQKENY